MTRFGPPDKFTVAHVLGLSDAERTEEGVLQAFRNLIRDARTGAEHERGEVIHTLHALYDIHVQIARSLAGDGSDPERVEAMMSEGTGVIRLLMRSDGRGLITWEQLRRIEGITGRERKDFVGERQQRRRRAEYGRPRASGRPTVPDVDHVALAAETADERKRRLARERKRRQRKKSRPRERKIPPKSHRFAQPAYSLGCRCDTSQHFG